MNPLRFSGSLLVIVLGAIMLAEGVLSSVTGTSIFFEGINPSFKVVVGFIVIILAASIMQDSKK